MTNTEELSRLLTHMNKRRGEKFSVGVYSASTLPNTFHKPAAFIVNTDRQHEPGTHWVAMFFPQRGGAEYFDSYGLPPLVSEHAEFLNRSSTSWTYNHIPLQGLYSEVCGHYCVAFLRARMSGYSMKTFQYHFSEDSKHNDALVRDGLAEKLKQLRKKTHTGGQHCCSKVSSRFKNF
jgi:hypothetical protein